MPNGFEYHYDEMPWLNPTEGMQSTTFAIVSTDFHYAVWRLCHHVLEIKRLVKRITRTKSFIREILDFA